MVCRAIVVQRRRVCRVTGRPRRTSTPLGSCAAPQAAGAPPPGKPPRRAPEHRQQQGAQRHSGDEGIPSGSQRTDVERPPYPARRGAPGCAVVSRFLAQAERDTCLPLRHTQWRNGLADPIRWRATCQRRISLDALHTRRVNCHVHGRTDTFAAHDPLQPLHLPCAQARKPEILSPKIWTKSLMPLPRSCPHCSPAKARDASNRNASIPTGWRTR